MSPSEGGAGGLGFGGPLRSLRDVTEGGGWHFHTELVRRTADHLVAE